MTKPSHASVAPKYQRRLRKLVDVLTRCGFDCQHAGRNLLSLHAAARAALKSGPQFDTAEAASQYLITEHSICTVPWDDAGAYLAFFRHVRSRRTKRRKTR